MYCIVHSCTRVTGYSSSQCLDQGIYTCINYSEIFSPLCYLQGTKIIYVYLWLLHEMCFWYVLLRVICNLSNFSKSLDGHLAKSLNHSYIIDKRCDFLHFENKMHCTCVVLNRLQCLGGYLWRALTCWIFENYHFNLMCMILNGAL